MFYFLSIQQQNHQLFFLSLCFTSFIKHDLSSLHVLVQGQDDISFKRGIQQLTSRHWHENHWKRCCIQSTSFCFPADTQCELKTVQGAIFNTTRPKQLCVNLSAWVNLNRKSTLHFHGYFRGMQTSPSKMCPNSPPPRPHLTHLSHLPSPHPHLNEREGASVQDCAVCTADHRGGEPKITAATVEMLEVGGNRWGAEVSEDRT